ncbi:hypothetical protein ACTK7J_000483 [Escherichia coli]|uniref:hypothetical protein n=2 Tax=Escherichia coli TaxID=562 RepID=UPI0001FB8312|nr:hypothetical protein [Escherichia coli]EGB37489.1 hypothetical protein ERDG_02218 [Escherichia coli E482]EGP9752749.1 hypothetical protein [Escherichia coli]EGS1766596.1 hypothetical protein [Escherichia coli]EHY2895506.1 hypothetical protein [Escherichia coli]EIT7768716.1 hypothetical protein [Escherichia coli]
MDEQMEIDQLTKQFQILDEEQSKLPAGPQKTALQKAAGKVKNQLVTKLNAQKTSKPEAAKPEQPKQQGPKTPDINSYFSGDFLDESMAEYFSPELPEEMSRYFVRNEDAFSDAPSMPIQQIDQSTADKQAQEEADRAALRKRILHAVGVF